MSSETPASSPAAKRSRRIGRILAFALFFIISALLFVGGAAALLYFLFSQYTGVRNVWLLACGAPVVVIVFIILVVLNLYLRFGRPMENLFDAINAVEEGNLSVRVKVDKNDIFSDLFQRFNKMVGELERAEQQRRNLTADIAHELRTPLHIIQGNLEGVIDGVYQPTPDHLTATLEETHLLTRLVNDLQTLSLAETGQLPLHPTRFLLGDLMDDLVSSFSAQAASRRIALTAASAGPAREITADYDRLNQVLSNLVSNALRHTPPGGAIALAAGPAPGKDSRVQITVRDTGSGIAAEDLPFIFDRFWRADKSRRDRTHSGLGLAIARQLIHAHGGTIEAESTPGRGAAFTITLPGEIS